LVKIDACSFELSW